MVRVHVTVVGNRDGEREEFNLECVEGTRVGELGERWLSIAFKRRWPESRVRVSERGLKGPLRRRSLVLDGYDLEVVGLGMMEPRKRPSGSGAA